MVFDYWLPWPVVVLLLIAACIAMIVYVVRYWKLDPKTYLGVWIIFAIMDIIAAIAKIGKGLNLYKEEPFSIIIFKVLAIPAVILLIVGGYQKLGNDPIRQRGFVIYIVVSIIILVVLYGLFLISLKI